MTEKLNELPNNDDSSAEVPEVASNFRSISVTTRTSSLVVLHWLYENVRCDQELVFKVLQLQSRSEWKPIAWTRKSTCTIENLEQNVCYSLRILVLVEGEDEFRVTDESDVFKVIYAS